MKFFFWELDNKGKFIRALWTGLLALVFLYGVCWYFVDDLLIKTVIPFALTIIFITDLALRYKKIQRMKAQS